MKPSMIIRNYQLFFYFDINKLLSFFKVKNRLWMYTNKLVIIFKAIPQFFSEFETKGFSLVYLTRYRINTRLS
jgi:hypothetical protein